MLRRRLLLIDDPPCTPDLNLAVFPYQKSNRKLATIARRLVILPFCSPLASEDRDIRDRDRGVEREASKVK